MEGNDILRKKRSINLISDIILKRKYEEELGFDKPQLDPEIKATCGCVSDESFGHSGFTGAYTWADPESEILYVFLSNRVFPTMENYGLVDEDIRTENTTDYTRCYLAGVEWNLL